MDTIKIINYIIMVVFFVCYAYQFAYIPLALLKKQKPLPDGKLHRFAVLIAARNEEAVIGNLIDSLRHQSYPSELTDIYVVADNCTDRTAEAAHTHGARVVRRYDRNRIGKGYALHYLLRHIHKSYDAYLVFDADNVVDSNYIREINKTFSAGYDIVTSYRNSKNYGDNWISAGYGLWFLREALHYLADSFTFAHNQCFAGNLAEHRLYEKLLHSVFAEYLYTQTVKLTLSDEFTHEQYLQERRSFLTDCRYILGASIALWHQLSILQAMPKPIRHLALQEL